MKITVKILENSISEAPLDTVAKLTGTTGQKKAAARLASAFPLPPKKSWKDITLLALKGLKVAVKSKNINDINKFIRQADDALYDHDPTHPARETLNQLRNYNTKKLSALAASGDASEVDTAIRQVMYEQTNIREIEETPMKITRKILEKIIKEELQAVIEDQNVMSFTEKEVEEFDRKQTAAEKDPIKQKENMIKALEAKIKNEKDKNEKKKLQDKLKKLKAELAGPGENADQKK